jgi:hypothetical protein
VAGSSTLTNARLFAHGTAARLDLLSILKLRLPRLEVGPVPTLLAGQVKRARATLATRRLSLEEAELAEMDAHAAAVEATLVGP